MTKYSITPNILIVEDEAQMRNSLQTVLVDSQFQVSVATDGTEGLKIALKEHPDLILLDILMPRTDGIEMLRQLRNDSWGKSVPVILLTNVDPDPKLIKAITENNPAFYLLKAQTSLNEIVDKIKLTLA